MITAIGIAVLDMILVIDGFKEGEGSFYCDEFIVEGGGMAATALCAASKLGSQTRLFTRIGDDAHGRFIIEELHRFGVDTSGIITVHGKQTTASIVFVDSRTGEKQFYSQHEKPVFTDFMPLDTTKFKGTTVLLVDGHWIEGAQDGIAWAKSRGIPVVGDFKKMYSGIERILKDIDYLIIPSFFAEEITGENYPEAMLKKLSTLLPGVPVITRGADGGSYLVNGELREYRVFPVSCVDSTGAGDSFHGAFCHFLDHGLNIDRCLELASAVGALNCRSVGGRRSLPSREELESFMKAQGLSGQFP